MSDVTIAIVAGAESGRELRVEKSLLVGRGPGSDLVIPEPDVSTRHARLTPSGSAISIEDLESTNGTRVNGLGVRDRVLVDGDEIRLGATVLRYEAV